MTAVFETPPPVDYTESGPAAARTGFGAMMSPPITDRTLLKILSGGFALVMVLLVVAGVVGARGARTLERDAGRLVHQQLLTARLISEIESEQATINAIFYKLIRAPQPEAATSFWRSWKRPIRSSPASPPAPPTRRKRAFGPVCSRPPGRSRPKPAPSSPRTAPPAPR